MAPDIIVIKTARDGSTAVVGKGNMLRKLAVLLVKLEESGKQIDTIVQGKLRVPAPLELELKGPIARPYFEVSQKKVKPHHAKKRTQKIYF